MIKLIIAGSRSFNDYDRLSLEVMKFAIDCGFYQPPVIVSGTAIGADKLGEQFAKQYGLSIERYPANWSEHGKRAGWIRNEQMANIATHCICFWDGKSSGTRSMIDLAEQYKLKYRVITF